MAEPETPLDETVVNLIRKGRFTFSPRTRRAPEDTMRVMPGYHWPTHPMRDDRADSITINQDCPYLRRVGEVTVHSVDGTIGITNRDGAITDKLPCVPKLVLDAIVDALQKDRSAYGPHCYQLYDAQYDRLEQHKKQ